MAGYYDISNLDHAPELASALGNLVVAWANAEVALAFAFAAACGINANLAHFGYYRIPTFEARTKVIRAMLLECKSTKYDTEAIFKAVTKLNGLAKARNDWIHGIWSLDRDTNQTVTFDFRAQEHKGRVKPVKAADVLNHVEAVRARTKELRDLLPDLP